jgi:hypothetical protein
MAKRDLTMTKEQRQRMSDLIRHVRAAGDYLLRSGDYEYGKDLRETARRLTALRGELVRGD